MEDRYSYDKEGPAPCRICGEKVRERLVKEPMSPTDAAPPVSVRRECLNPRCPSNNGDTSVGDVV